MHVQKSKVQHPATLRHGVARIVLALLAAPLLSLPALAARAAPPVNPFDDCEQYSMAGKHECIEKLAIKSALALKKAEAKADGVIARWDEDDSYIQQARARLRASNTAFASYRLHQCAFAMASIGGGAGNARGTTQLTCVAEKNLQRVQELASETGVLERR
ncbi:DUF1311 domain-containing protein [Massilia sp. CCM 8692]|uniref:DUF1311 domain-containing protein n=1 Tax=Massilia rubra TaxID=2607910 RepID=A0ABX0LQR5_9BURK|nr:lysozyme inhibitor LprI family protein [Massilia rubra]NHZ34237.1 DUF1311 domain-containing protein [Massilia rubra]